MSIFRTCCFTGHRPHKLPFLLDEDHPQYRLLEQRLTKEILEKILMHDCDTFLTGMAQGVDMLCAELVLKLRKLIGVPLRLVCVIPYLAQAQRWDTAEQARYKSILARNRFLVDHSMHIIAVYDGMSAGGTKYTCLLYTSECSRYSSANFGLRTPQKFPVLRPRQAGAADFR